MNKAVTALRDSDGNLRMQHWSVTEENLLPLAETGNAYLAEPARDIAITRLNGCNFNVTALRDDLVCLESAFAIATHHSPSHGQQNKWSR